MELDKDKFIKELKARALKNKGVDFEFQEVGKEISEYFGRRLYWIFSEPWCTEFKARQALKICKEKKNKKVPYFIGIIKKL